MNSLDQIEHELSELILAATMTLDFHREIMRQLDTQEFKSFCDFLDARREMANWLFDKANDLREAWNK